ncbi:MAG: DMP19 family protein, partial [Fibrobacter sp.]|nr:DMP19 family protein [Fibrobacter sp.]
MVAKIHDAVLAAAAQKGMDAFVEAVVSAIYDAIGGELTAETMAQLNADQVTLLAYKILRDEVMDGGFVQLIHNGYGAFIYKNPFARMLKQWGVTSLGQMISRSHKYYGKYHEQIERDMTDDEFMAA